MDLIPDLRSFSNPPTPNTMSTSSVEKTPTRPLLHACGVTVSGPGRISSRDGTVAWTSGTFITIQEHPQFGHLTQFQTKVRRSIETRISLRNALSLALETIYDKNVFSALFSVSPSPPRANASPLANRARIPVFVCTIVNKTSTLQS